MLHPQSEQALRVWARGPLVTDPGFGAAGIERLRRLARHEAGLEAVEPVDRVQNLDGAGVPCRAYVPAGATGLIVYLHGGGFVFGDLDTHDRQSRRLAVRTGLAVLSVDYRRPPEHRFPAAPRDVDRVVSWLRSPDSRHGLPADRLVVLGDSAGGNLALVAALRRPEVFVAAVLVYPFLDPETVSSTYRTEDNPGLTAAEAGWYWKQYAARPADLRHPDLAPLRSTALGGLPPTLVQAAEHDVLVGENGVLARRIADAGGTVRLTTYPGMVHGFWRHPALFDAAEQALSETADFLGRHT